MYQNMYASMYEDTYGDIYKNKKKRVKRNKNKNKFVLFCLIIFISLSIYLIWVTFGHADNAETLVSNTDNNQMQNNVDKIVVDLNSANSTDNSNTANEITGSVTQQSSDKIFYIEIGDLELPISGATGYASVVMPLKVSPTLESEVINQLPAGTAFQIIQEKGDWWQVQLNSTTGWLEHKYCMINLPDVVPSIIYDNTNSYSSLFMSSGYEIPNITGKALYDVKKLNSRLGKEEFIMPVIYGMAKKICAVQQLALKDGNCLKIYETFRPYTTQMSVAKSLNDLIKSNQFVNAGINNAGWNQSWFIAQSLSNHQRGVAIDVSLVRILDKKVKSVGNYSYTCITNYEEYEMPTQMHELSISATTFKYPVSPSSWSSWTTAPLSSTMNDNAIKLQNYCTSMRLSPLASEWWHFNDLETKQSINDNLSNGQYFINKCLSIIPTRH